VKVINFEPFLSSRHVAKHGQYLKFKSKPDLNVYWKIICHSLPV